MTTTQGLAASFELARGILVGLTPAHYDLPTPCASWNVRALANHVVRAANWFAPCVNTGAAPDPDPTIGLDYAAGDLVGSFDAGVAASLAAFSAPGALERIVRVHFGPLPGAVFLVLATNDMFTHSWDLARATGLPADFDVAICGGLLAELQSFLPDSARGADGVAPFGPALSPPPEASAADRLAAFLGRQV